MDSAAMFRAPAGAYDRLVGRYSPALAQALTAVAGIRAGQRVLDVGCGPGALTRVLAGLVGADRVAAVDPSAPFVAACAERVPGADVREGAAEALPFGDATFDAALSQLVVNFMADAPAGVREMRRVVRPGGTIAACVWDYREGMTLLRSFWDAAVRVDPQGAARDEGRVMRWCSPEELGRLLAELDGVRTGELTVSADYADFDDLWAPFEAGAGPAGAHTVSLDPDRREALRDELHRGLGSPDGPFTLSARAWYAVGTA